MHLIISVNQFEYMLRKCTLFNQFFDISGSYLTLQNIPRSITWARIIVTPFDLWDKILIIHKLKKQSGSNYALLKYTYCHYYSEIIPF